MQDTFGDWQVIARRTNKRSWHLLGIVLQTLLLVAEPFTWSSVTWTLRHRTSGATRAVTARSEAEAQARIAAGLFDGDPPAR